jgi:hypothetical protein
MARGIGILVEKVVGEVDVVAEVGAVAEVDVVDGVVILMMREVDFEDKIVMKMTKDSRKVSCSCLCIILCDPV